MIALATSRIDHTRSNRRGGKSVVQNAVPTSTGIHPRPAACGFPNPRPNARTPMQQHRRNPRALRDCSEPLACPPVCPHVQLHGILSAGISKRVVSSRFPFDCQQASVFTVPTCKQSAIMISTRPSTTFARPSRVDVHGSSTEGPTAALMGATSRYTPPSQRGGPVEQSQRSSKIPRKQPRTASRPPENPLVRFARPARRNSCGVAAEGSS